MIKELLQEIENKNISIKKVKVGELSDEIIEFLKNRNIEVYTKTIYVNAKSLSHLNRDSKKRRGAGLTREEILKIPEMIKNVDIVYFDSRKNKLNLLYCKNRNRCEEFIKLVIDTRTLDKKLGKITLIKTAGIVKYYNLEDKYYIKVLEMEGR